MAEAEDTIWLPLEIWADLLVDFLSIRDIGRFTQVCKYTQQISQSDVVWGRIFNRTITSGVSKKRTKRHVTRVPRRVTSVGRTLPFRTRYIRLLYWFYETEIRTRGAAYPLSLTIHRPRKLRTLEDTTLIPPSWLRKRETALRHGSSLYRRLV